MSRDWGDTKKLYAFRYGLDNKNLDMIEENLTDMVDFTSLIDYLGKLEKDSFKSRLVLIVKRFLHRNTGIPGQEKFLHDLELFSDYKEIHEIVYDSLLKKEVQSGMEKLKTIDSMFSMEMYHDCAMGIVYEHFLKNDYEIGFDLLQNLETEWILALKKIAFWTTNSSIRTVLIKELTRRKYFNGDEMLWIEVMKVLDTEYSDGCFSKFNRAHPYLVSGDVTEFGIISEVKSSLGFLKKKGTYLYLSIDMISKWKKKDLERLVRDDFHSYVSGYHVKKILKYIKKNPCLENFELVELSPFLKELVLDALCKYHGIFIESERSFELQLARMLHSNSLFSILDFSVNGEISRLKSVNIDVKFHEKFISLIANESYGSLVKTYQLRHNLLLPQIVKRSDDLSELSSNTEDFEFDLDLEYYLVHLQPCMAYQHLQSTFRSHVNESFEVPYHDLSILDRYMSPNQHQELRLLVKKIIDSTNDQKIHDSCKEFDRLCNLTGQADTSIQETILASRYVGEKSFKKFFQLFDPTKTILEVLTGFTQKQNYLPVIRAFELFDTENPLYLLFKFFHHKTDLSGWKIVCTDLHTWKASVLKIQPTRPDVAQWIVVWANTLINVYLDSMLTSLERYQFFIAAKFEGFRLISLILFESDIFEFNVFDGLDVLIEKLYKAKDFNGAWNLICRYGDPTPYLFSHAFQMLGKLEEVTNFDPIFLLLDEAPRPSGFSFLCHLIIKYPSITLDRMRIVISSIHKTRNELELKLLQLLSRIDKKDDRLLVFCTAYLSQEPFDLLYIADLIENAERTEMESLMTFFKAKNENIDSMKVTDLVLNGNIVAHNGEKDPKKILNDLILACTSEVSKKYCKRALMDYEVTKVVQFEYSSYLHLSHEVILFQLLDHREKRLISKYVHLKHVQKPHSIFSRWIMNQSEYDVSGKNVFVEYIEIFKDPYLLGLDLWNSLSSLNISTFKKAEIAKKAFWCFEYVKDLEYMYKCQNYIRASLYPLLYEIDVSFLIHYLKEVKDFEYVAKILHKNNFTIQSDDAMFNVELSIWIEKSDPNKIHNLYKKYSMWTKLGQYLLKVSKSIVELLYDKMKGVSGMHRSYLNDMNATISYLSEATDCFVNDEKFQLALQAKNLMNLISLQIKVKDYCLFYQEESQVRLIMNSLRDFQSCHILATFYNLNILSEWLHPIYTNCIALGNMKFFTDYQKLLPAPISLWKEMIKKFRQDKGNEKNLRQFIELCPNHASRRELVAVL